MRVVLPLQLWWAYTRMFTPEGVRGWSSVLNHSTSSGFTSNEVLRPSGDTQRVENVGICSGRQFCVMPWVVRAYVQTKGTSRFASIVLRWRG